MSDTETYTPGQHLDINGETVILTTRKGANGIKWSWLTADTEISAERYFTTPGDAHAHACETLGAPPCRHKVYGWCPDCNARDL